MGTPVVKKECEAALQRLELSQTFARSGNLLRLLRFMMEHSDESGEGAKQVYIGNVFYGRPGTYDPRYDSVVRVSVKRLRTRLIEYYAGEGKNEVHRIVIPLGTYRVTLETVELPPPPDPVEPIGSAIAAAGLESRRRSWWTWKTVTVVAFGLGPRDRRVEAGAPAGNARVADSCSFRAAVDPWA